MSSLLGKLTENIVGYVMSLLIGALFMMLLNSSARDARLTVLEKQQDELASDVRAIQKTMAEGGPPALAQRVDALYKMVENQNAKLDRLIELAARR